MHVLLRWLITGGTGGLVLLVGLTCLAGWRALPDALAATPAVPAVVRAQRLVVIDATGAARAALGMEDAAAGLTLYDQDNNRRLTLNGEDDASINWMDGRQRLRLTCGFAEEKCGLLAIITAQKHPGLMLGVLMDGSPSLTLSDGTGTRTENRLVYGLEDGIPNLTLGARLAPRPRGVISLGLTEVLMPRVTLYDQEDQQRSAIILYKHGEPMWLLLDRAHKLRASLTIEEGKCVLALCNAAAQPRLMVEDIDADGPGCTLSDARQTVRAELRVDPQERCPHLLFSDQRAMQRMSCQLNTDDDGLLLFRDRTQHVRGGLQSRPGLACFTEQEIPRTMLRAPSDDLSRYLQFCDTSGKALLWSAPPVR